MDIEKLAEKARSQLKSDKKVEARDATPAPSAETEKTKVEVKEPEKSTDVVKNKVEEATKKAEKDEAILSKSDDKLEPEEKARKAELLKVKQESEDKEAKSNVQKRIDELTGKIKDIENDRNSTKAERDALKTELDDIKKKLSMTPEDVVKEKVKSELTNLQKKYVDEDKRLPREEKREMPKEELDEWLLEDYEGASEWLTRRSIRRVEEERDLRNKELGSIRAKETLAKQMRSQDKVLARHPDLDMDRRKAELEKEGKSKDEIFRIICNENPKYKLCADILHENPDKYLQAENGPELVVEEMERRLKKPESPEIDAIKKELAELRAENARLKNVDVGVTSTRQSESKTPQSDLEKEQEKIALKVGLDPKRLKARIEERAKHGYDS